jgi:hypothetical protein
MSLLRRLSLARSPLDAREQCKLREQFSGNRLEDCDRYSWFDLPDGTTFTGYWDLRSSWRPYLGDVDFHGLRVLELGPACGFLSLKMESEGAEVVALDLPNGVAQDLISVPGTSDSAMHHASVARIQKFRKSWWYFHRVFGSQNKAVYADIYRLPSTLGRFDASVFASVLLHLQNPYEALRQAAKITDRVIVVTDIFSPNLGEGAMQFCPTDEPWTWWYISPTACIRMLDSLGFQASRVTVHRQRFHPKETIEPSAEADFFTVIAMRRDAPANCVL